jgi:hypothetical protein
VTGVHNKQVITGLTVVLLAAIGVLWLVPTQTVTTATGENDLSPSLVPHISLGVCLVLGIILSVRAWRDGRLTGSDNTPEFEEAGEVDEAPRSVGAMVFDLLVWIASSTAAVMIIPQIGFIATAAVLLAGWLVFAGVRSIAIIAGVSLVLPVVLDRLCWYALTVQLP